MFPLDKTDWEILNVTADDCENLEQIYRGVCYEMLVVDSQEHSERAYTYRPIRVAPLLTTVADRIRALVEKGLLEVVMDEEGRPLTHLDDLSYVWRAWFQMTPTGRNAWESSEYLVEQE